MDKEVKHLIEDNIDLIENERFEYLYDKMKMRSLGLIGKFTETLLNAGIDPANYLKELPRGYLADTSIQHYDVPETINRLGRYAFANCTELTSISLPDRLTFIGISAFMSCYNLSDIVLPESLIEIESQAFYGCKHLKTIKYLGTVAQWESIQKGAVVFTRTETVQCRDGNIDLLYK